MSKFLEQHKINIFVLVYVRGQGQSPDHFY